MIGNVRNRFIVFAVFTVALFAILFIQLARLTLVEGEKLAAQGAGLSQRTITLSGARGSILDRNGLPLAYDVKSYNVKFYRDPNKNTETDRAYYTSVIMQTIEIIERNGGKTVDSFVIKRDEKTGEYYFDFGITNPRNVERREEEWRKNMYVTSESLKTPEQVYLYLRNRYKIPSELGYEEAAKILSIWQDVQLSSWVAYKPVTVAYNVSLQTVAEIQTKKDTLTGMTIEDSTTRVYPKGSVAAHVIGYMGRITEDTLGDVGGYGFVDNDHYTLGELNRGKLNSDRTASTTLTLSDLGYSVDDLIGVSGVEKSMEAYLSGNRASRQGKQVVLVDNMRVVQKVVSSTEPVQGDNVMLTIDLQLQQVVEKSLADNIPRIREEQVAEFRRDRLKPVSQQKYKDRDLEDLNLAESGAVVVMDVNTGDVLAMASYPSFDLNLFVGGIDEETYNTLKDDKAAPLFNKAIASKATPGSIFKMVTGLGALMEGEKDRSKGTTLTETITCEGTYTKDIINLKDAPKCWKRVGYAEAHKDQDIVKGLEHSCNFYFYTLAGRMGIDLVDKWAEKFGLTSSTGIQLPGEAIGQIGNQQEMFNPYREIEKQSSALPMLVWKTGPNSVYNLIKKYADQVGREYTDEEILEAARDIVKLMGVTWHTDENNVKRDENGVTIGQRIREILYNRLDISQKVSGQLSTDIASTLSELMWTPALTVRTGIGQGITAVTPIAVARYVSAIANGGTVYQANIIDKVVAQDGTVVLDQQPRVFGTLDAPRAYLDAIKKGMKGVVSEEEGTASNYFRDFPEEYLSLLAGKTGTAQVSTIDLENNSWFVCFAPYSADDPSVKPEIAVVVYVPHGYSGALSSYVAQDIIRYYMDQKKVVAEQTIPDPNSLLF